MLSLPSKIPDPIIEHCMGCTTNQEVLDTLKTNTDLFIKFFKAASEDADWTRSNQTLVEKMVSHLDTLSQNGHLRLDQARAARLTAQVAATIIDSKELKEFAEDDVTIQAVGGDVKIGHALLFSESEYFTKLFTGGFMETASKTVAFPEMDVKTATLLKGFLETGTLPKLEERDVLSLIQTSKQYLLPDLASYLAENHMTANTFMECLDLGYSIQSKDVRDRCFQFINDNFEGIRISAQGFKDMSVVIDQYSKDLELLEHCFRYFNPDVEKAYVSPDFKLSVKVGKEAFPLERDETEFISVNIFKLFPYARDVDLSEAAPLVDSAIYALGKCCPKLERANLSGGRFLTDESVQFLVEACSGLKGLSLEGCSNITDSTLHAIAKTCGKNLLELKLDGLSQVSDAGIGSVSESCPNLQVLSIGCTDKITDVSLESIASHLTKVEELTINSCNKVSSKGLGEVIDSLPLKKLAITEHPEQKGERALVDSALLSHIAEKRSGIQQLNFTVSREHGMTGLTYEEGLTAIGKACKHLTALELSYQSIDHPTLESAISKEVIWDLITNNPGLTRISVGKNIDDELLDLISNTCPNLKAIDLAHCAISNESLIRFSEKCKKLEELSLGWNYPISNETFQKVVDNCPRIHKLSIVICNKINFEGIAYSIRKLPLESLTLVPGEDNFESYFGIHSERAFITSDTLALIGQYCPNMKHLYINRRFDEADSKEALLLLARGCRNLETCEIQARGIDFEVLSAMLKNNRKLSTLNIGRLPTIEDASIEEELDLKTIALHPSIQVLNLKTDHKVKGLSKEFLEALDNVKVNIDHR